MAGQYIANLYDQMENEVVADIARRVKKTNRFTETAEIQAKALRAQGYSPAKIQAEVMKRLNADNDYLQFVAENTRAYKQEVKQLIKETVAQAVIDGDALIAAAGDMAWNDDLQVWADHGVDLKKDNTLRQFQKAFTEQTVGELKNITRTTALQVAGVPILDAYHHELDLAVLKVASGSFSFTQAMEDCCRRLGSNGVAVIYPSGKKYSLEAATRMTMKTGLSQLAGKVTEHNLEKTGTALVYVSAHAGARPEHAEWQGKVYTYTGEPSKKYPDFYEATGYGTLTGLKGVNCSHEFYPHWEGDPIPEFREPDPVTIDGKDYTFYEATQEQRKMERQVRNMKREQAAAEAAGDQKKAAELEAKIRATRQEYGQFSQQAGLRAKYERMGIFDGNNNGGSKAAWVMPPTPAQAIAEMTKKQNISEIKTLKNIDKEVKAQEQRTLDRLALGKQWNILTKEDYKKYDELLTDLVDKNEFRMRIPADDAKTIKAIINDGQIKNQFDTQTSKGALDNELRKKASIKMYGIKGEVEGSDLEKYGYLGSADILKDDKGAVKNYGSGIVTLKKSAMMERTTITEGDSLATFRMGENRIRPCKVTEINSMACSDHAFDASGNYLKDKIKEIDEISEKKRADVNSFSRLFGGTKNGYLELQYHGDLTLQDIESICLDKKVIDELTPDEVEKLKINGVKILYKQDKKIIEI